METIVFTNGCFDLIHPGHIDLLTKARALGTKLIVGINSDRSVRAIKGNGRPLQSEEARKNVLLGLKAVDEVVVFDEPTPERIIKEVRPDVLVKGGDWKPKEIIGADLVESYGGKVYSIPLTPGFSTSGIADKMNTHNVVDDDTQGDDLFINSTAEHLKTIGAVQEECRNQIGKCAELLTETFRQGHKVLICGNGGSAADAQHIAAEFVGRYENERRALPAIALTTDTSALTALANDYDFERIFARQIEALASAGDCLIAISTSGNSPNVIAAVMKAREKGCKVVGMTGQSGKKLAGLCDVSVRVPSTRTARIQEAHILIAHIWCEVIEADLASAQ
ncbi:MAG: D-sedoheptulose 7-phosphate isomerase [Acidobacteria bacterium]|nr:D-sedoheptulose 7-phosphate isomerase [Acidobacteriota bacterium]